VAQVEDNTDAVAHGPPGWEPWPDDHELTPFQVAVIDAVEAMTYGEVATYNDIAHEIGRPGSAQAVSNVLRHAPDLPWWRILPSDGRLYRTHERYQRPLLEAEGHTITADRRVLADQ
jgi:alkylated DNA nucleotide flippase Atl1